MVYDHLTLSFNFVSSVIVCILVIKLSIYSFHSVLKVLGH